MGILESIKADMKNVGANKGKFIYFREGEKKRVRFLEDMEDAHEVVFHDNWEMRVNYPCKVAYGKPCKYCRDSSMRTRKFYIWSVYDYDANDVLLFMFAVNNCSPVSALAAMYEQYGTLCDRDYIISTTGKQTNKTYSVVPSDKNSFKNKAVVPYTKTSVLRLVAKAYPDDDETDEMLEEEKKKEADTDAYKGMRPVQLYKLCQERGIDVPQRKPAEFYIGKLREWDEENADWGEEGKEADEWGEAGDYDDGFMNVPDEIGEELPFN